MIWQQFYAHNKFLKKSSQKIWKLQKKDISLHCNQEKTTKNKENTKKILQNRNFLSLSI